MPLPPDAHDHAHPHDEHAHEHDHGHAHGHDHGDHSHPAAADAHDGDGNGPHELLERAISSLLIQKGVLTEADIQRQMDFMASRNPSLGARIVAKAWTDPAFRHELLADTHKALHAHFDIDLGTMVEFRVIEQGARDYHMVVCTLCSCYPRLILGVPPAWYKSRQYRARAVSDPRGVLREFGTELPDSIAVHVHDSTADLRYLVIPRRPAGTEGWSAERLAKLVTRDSMIGTQPALPASAA